MTHLALRLKVSLDKHVEVLANSVLVGVPELDVLQQRQRHGVVGNREAQLHGACQVLHCHGCVAQHKTVEGPESLACIWHVVVWLFFAVEGFLFSIAKLHMIWKRDIPDHMKSWTRVKTGTS